MKKFITHGLTYTELDIESPGGWYHEMQVLGQNYRLSDIHSVLGLSQLKKLDSFVGRRREIVKRYEEAFSNIPEIKTPPSDSIDFQSAWHLYAIRVDGKVREKRAEIFEALRSRNIWVQVHYIPVYYHPYYKSLGYEMGLCPEAEDFYDRVISIPIYPNLLPEEQEYVIETIKDLVS